MKILSPFEKIYNSDYVRNPWDKPTPDFPNFVDIEPTNMCNMNCIMCSQRFMTRPKGYMDIDLAYKIIDEVARYGSAIRLFRLGEPLLHKDLFKMISYATEKGILTHITSNGLLMKGKVIEEVFSSGLSSIIFSFQGASKTGYEKMRGEGNYDTVVSNIKKLVHERDRKGLTRPFIMITSTMTDETEEEIDSFLKKWEAIVDKVGIGKTNLTKVEKNTEETIDNNETIKKIFKRCSEIFTKLSVDWDGVVTACCGDFSRELEVGNLKDNTLHEIWKNSERLKTLRKDILNQKHYKYKLCSTCYKNYDFD